MFVGVPESREGSLQRMPVVLLEQGREWAKTRMPGQTMVGGGKDDENDAPFREL